MRELKNEELVEVSGGHESHALVAGASDGSPLSFQLVGDSIIISTSESGYFDFNHDGDAADLGETLLLEGQSYSFDIDGLPQDFAEDFLADHFFPTHDFPCC